MPSSCELGGLESDPVARDPTAQRGAPIEVTTPERQRQPQQPKSQDHRKDAGAAAAIPERGGLRRPGPRARVECAIKVNAAQNACRAGQLGPARAVRHLVPSSCELGGLESDPVAHARAAAVAPIEVTTPNAGASSGLRPRSQTKIGSRSRSAARRLRRPGPRARVEVRH